MFFDNDFVQLAFMWHNFLKVLVSYNVALAAIQFRTVQRNHPVVKTSKCMIVDTTGKTEL